MEALIIRKHADIFLPETITNKTENCLLLVKVFTNKYFVLSGLSYDMLRCNKLVNMCSVCGGMSH